MTTTTAPAVTPLQNLYTGADPASVHADLLDVVEAAMLHQPRTLQTRIGPSEIGMDCVRCLAHKLAGTPERPEAAWLPYLGTAVHEELSTVFIRHEHTRQDLGLPPRFLSEHRVTVGTIGGQEITGSTDLFDIHTGTIVDFKGLARDTTIPTPTGWTTIAAIQPGDQLFAGDGTVCTVVQKSPIYERPCYRITFEDGTSVVADNVHEWPLLVGATMREEVMSTEQAAKQVFQPWRGGQRQLRIANAGRLSLPDADLPVPPYTLGAWIGDGHSWSGHIGKPDQELFEHIATDGYEIGPTTDKRGLMRNVRGLIADLRAAGLIRNKHIPAAYLRASFDQRLALLQGLMDTDGTWNRPRKQAVFVTVNKALAHDVYELICSLGWRALVSEVQRTGFGKNVTAYDVSFVPFEHNPFRLSRKANLVRIEGSSRCRRRIIRSIEPTLTVPTQCIEVDSPDHTFLVTESMVRTHNCVGTATMRKAKAVGASDQYRIQANLYALGWEAAGYQVRSTLIWFMPRNAISLRDGYAWQAPVDPRIAHEALARADKLAVAIQQLGAAAVIDAQPEHTGDAFTCRRYSDFHPLPAGGKSTDPFG